MFRRFEANETTSLINGTFSVIAKYGMCETISGLKQRILTMPSDSRDYVKLVIQVSNTKSSRKIHFCDGNEIF